MHSTNYIVFLRRLVMAMLVDAIEAEINEAKTPAWCTQ
jgi:hypothetical protein